MLIRQMEARDLAQVAPLATQLGYPSTESQLEAPFQKLQSSPNAALFVAEIDGQIAGWIQISRETQSLIAAARAEIMALVVDERQRGQKVGAKLIAKAEGWAKQNNLRLIRVRSNVIRERAHKFYQREGYSIKKTWHLFTKEV